MRRFLGAALLVLAGPVLSQESEPAWTVERDADGQTISALITLPDQSGVAVRCKRGELAVMVGFNRRLADKPPVTASYRFDDGGLMREEWGLSVKGHLAFAPQPLWLARQLARHNSFFVEVLSANEYPNQATFPLDGSASAIRQVLRACPVDR